jgi:putative transposase
MFTGNDFFHWFQRLRLKERAEALINLIRSSEPSRLVQSGRGSMSGRFPSRKMGVTIQFESHKNELAHIHEMEHDRDVIEFYEQPPAIKLEYEGANGRRISTFHTPDFFVIRQETAGWEECKMQEDLLALEAKNPGRYCRDEDGVWRCPPGEAYAEQFGLYYRVKSSKDINWTYQRNIEFLDDYYRAEAPAVGETAREAVLSEARAEPGLTLEELFKRTQERATRDDIFMMIAREEVYVDLCAAALVEDTRVRIFPDPDTAAAYSHLVRMPPDTRAQAPRPVDLAAGSLIQWNGVGWRVANVGETLIGLVGEDESFTEIPVTVFDQLVREGRIVSDAKAPRSDVPDEVRKRFVEADQASLAEANRRAEMVDAYLRGDFPLKNDVVPERTLLRWVARKREAEEAYGAGFVGLIPRPRSGNGKRRLPPETERALNDFIKNDYETLKQKRKFEVYAAYLLACERQGIVAASYKTFCKTVKLRSRYEQILKRQGRRAAYSHKEFYWELTLTTPRHGERPFHICHIDHTQLDVELICSLTGRNLGRPWLSFLTDAYSRRVLVAYLTFDEPSYRTNMMIVRECVRRFGRFPQILVMDGGPEFSSVYFETLLARYECTKKTRPPAEARFGSVLERLFGTLNTEFAHNLQGNTQIMRNVRQVTKSVNPKGQAIWSLENLYVRLCEWAYEIYDTIEHPALGQTPRDAFASGLLRMGHRGHRKIPFNEDFRMLTLPTTSKGTAKVYVGRGVKINYIYYWCDEFRHPEVEGSRVAVRYDPWDAGSAFAYVSGKWVQCYSEHYATFRNRTERELMLATKEMRRRRQCHTGQLNITATKLAEFLESVEAEEALLRQRATDREARGIWAQINGGTEIRPAESDNDSRPESAVTDAPDPRPTPEPSVTIDLESYGEF